MREKMDNESGLTLVEVLATLVVASIVIVMIMNVHVLVQKQYRAQTASAHSLTDVSLAAKMITKAIRSYEKIEVDPSGEMVTFENEDGSETVTYKFEDDTLKVNGVSYIYEVKAFEIEQTDNEIQLMIKSDKVSPEKEVDTTIIVR